MRSIRDLFPDAWQWYDLQLGFVLNPLNWELSYTNYGFGARILKTGPLSFFLLTGSKDEH